MLSKAHFQNLKLEHSSVSSYLKHINKEMSEIHVRQTKCWNFMEYMYPIHNKHYSYKTNFCYWSYQGAYLLLLPAIHQRRIMVTGRVSISSSSTSMVKTTHRHFNGDFGDQNLGSWWLWGNHQLGSGNLEHTECKRSEVQKNFTLILSSHALAVLKIYPYLCAPNSVR